MNEGIPKRWRRAIIVPIEKPRQDNEPIAYRPISLTSTLLKTYESILARRFTRLLVEQFYDTKLRNQFGFLPGRSCAVPLTIATERIKMARKRNRVLMVTNFDFSKAFDRSDANIAIDKIMHLTKNAKFCKILMNLL